MVGFFHIRYVERDKVGVPDGFFNGSDPVYGECLEGIIGNQRIVSPDIHLETAGHLRHPAGDPAEPDESQCLRFELQIHKAQFLNRAPAGSRPP